MRTILVMLIAAGCGTTVSAVPLVHELQVHGDTLVVESCNLVWTVDHYELAAALLGGPGRIDDTSVGSCVSHGESLQGSR